MHPTSMSMKIAIFTILSRFGASAAQGRANVTPPALLAPDKKFVGPSRRAADRPAL
jgi:hypothetical protein